jgi:hypothetical protein
MEPLLDATSLMHNTAVYKQGDGFTTQFGNMREVQENNIVPQPKDLT